METYSQPKLAAAGIELDFVQDNHSLSRQVGVLRGLHFQKPPHAQAKLVRVTAGRVLDVAVDIRRGSPTYGRHVAVELDADSAQQLLIPVGFAHGFVTLEPDTEFLYKVSSDYAPQADAGIRWDSEELNIDWRLPVISPILSEKDAKLPRWSEFESPFA